MIEIYPLLEFDYVENYTGFQPVDFDAKPIVTELLGWVMGNTNYYDGTTIADYGISPENISYLPLSESVPCLMAVVELDGIYQAVEHFRIKSIKED